MESGERIGTFATFWQCQAIFILVGFVVAWYWAAWRRRLGRLAIERRGTARTSYCVPADSRPDLRRRRSTRRRPGAVAVAAQNNDATADASNLPFAPPVAVVMPVKGVHAESMSNWRTQLVSDYRGRVDYVFVVERASDPAAPVARRLCAERDDARLVVAGSSSSCSQKIYSMLAGVRAAPEDAEFILFLDDDIRVHRNTVGTLVESMQTHAPRMFLSNGFPFDLPSADGPFANYLTMVYHLVLLVAFSQGEWTKNVWGGCMILRADDLRGNAHGCVDKYRDGGYSDDLILAALCDEHGRTVGCPADAIFPQRMCGRQSTWQWWNYLRRQLFVMDTYATPHNRAVNHGMLLALSYLSAAVTSAMAFAAAHLATAAWMACVQSVQNERGLDDVSFAWITSAPWTWTFRASTRAALSAATFAAFAAALSGAREMYAQMGEMARLLGDEDAPRAVREIRWRRVAAAFWVTYSLVPLASVVTLLKPTVEWAGIRYRKRRGKVTRIETT